MARRYGKGEFVMGGAVPYEIEEDLSVGAFSVAYAALKPDGKRVFLKQYKSPSRLVDWYRPSIDYQNELKRRVSENPMLVSRTYDFIDFFEADRAFIQVFGFIEGGKDLRDYLREGRMPFRQRWEFATLFLLTLQRFHDAGIVHSDLKPENIYLMPASGPGGGWNVKLIDFDFTVLSGLKAPWHGSMGYVGTPRYLSPEHLRGEVPEALSDVFTAAIICHELLCEGGHPYPDEDGAYREAVLAGRVSPPRFVVPETPELAEFGGLLTRALSPRASDRPTAGELHHALQRARGAFPRFGKTDRPTAAPDPMPEPPPTSMPAPGGRRETAYGAYALAGSAGRLPDSRVALTFGRRSLEPLIGEDAKYADAEQFRIFSKPGEEGWWIVLPGTEPTNPPLVDGRPVSAVPVRLGNGSRIVTATSRKREGVEKGVLTVMMS